jgi:Na+-transporting NADH:ubiquinone oxidoreductase subunit NqrE
MNKKVHQNIVKWDLVVKLYCQNPINISFREFVEFHIICSIRTIFCSDGSYNLFDTYNFFVPLVHITCSVHIFVSSIHMICSIQTNFLLYSL